jgi:hypothetical protein
MKRFRIIGLALVAVFAMSAIASASASAFTEFVGTPVGGAITDANPAGNVHKFKTAVGTVECKQETSSGTVTAEKSATNKEKVKYSECKVTEPFAAAATVSEAEYLFNANGSVKVENTITVKTSLCTITVKPQSDTGITYANLAGGQLEVKTAVKNIVYSTSGLCGTKTNETGGEYSGIAVAKVAGGSLQVK